MTENRKLTDDDVEAVAEAIRTKMVEKFYQDLGHGVWGWIRKIIITALMGLAAYGAVKGIKID